MTFKINDTLLTNGNTRRMLANIVLEKQKLLIYKLLIFEFEIKHNHNLNIIIRDDLKVARSIFQLQYSLTWTLLTLVGAQRAQRKEWRANNRRQGFRSPFFAIRTPGTGYCREH